MTVGLIAGEPPSAMEPGDKRRKETSLGHKEHIELEKPVYDSSLHRTVVTATTSDVVTSTTSLPVEFISSSDGPEDEQRRNESKSKDSRTQMEDKEKGSDENE